jgi:hypothetical protein
LRHPEPRVKRGVSSRDQHAPCCVKNYACPEIPQSHDVRTFRAFQF